MALINIFSQYWFKDFDFQFPLTFKIGIQSLVTGNSSEMRQSKDFLKILKVGCWPGRHFGSQSFLLCVSLSAAFSFETLESQHVSNTSYYNNKSSCCLVVTILQHLLQNYLNFRAKNRYETFGPYLAWKFKWDFWGDFQRLCNTFHCELKSAI